ncbi:hypothetical protein H4683_003838 [Filibacter limicola]|uniref:Uncharacterized protein n=1 Tax=Sporosarcina limicola TaxID=34101 RepID=A0A927RGP7_9BACL|nr:hypothetical protein [Sporosarcina limicola]
MLKNKFKADDLLAVLHVIDTDGCFITADDIVIDDTQTGLTLYCENSISVLNEKQRKFIEIRNEQRSNNIDIMKTLTMIILNV